MTLSFGPVKGKDFATSLGPVLVTADEFDPSAGAMRASVNRRLYGHADLSESGGAFAVRDPSVILEIEELRW